MHLIRFSGMDASLLMGGASWAAVVVPLVLPSLWVRKGCCSCCGGGTRRTFAAACGYRTDPLPPSEPPLERSGGSEEAFPEDEKASVEGRRLTLEEMVAENSAPPVPMDPPPPPELRTLLPSVS